MTDTLREVSDFVNKQLENPLVKEVDHWPIYCMDGTTGKLYHIGRHLVEIPDPFTPGLSVWVLGIAPVD